MGGSPSIPQRNLTGELNTLFTSGLPQSESAFHSFTAGEPLLNESNQFALSNLQNVGQLINPLQTLSGQVPGQFAGYQNQLGGYNTQLGGYGKQLGALAPQLAGLVKDQQGVYSSLLPTLTSQGALNAEQQRQVDQATRAGFASRGNVMGNQALGAELLNRDQYRQQRFGTALQQALGLSGSIGGLTGQQAGLIGQQAGITGQQAGLTGQQAGLTSAQAGLQSGLASGIQGLQSGGLNQALGAEQGSIGSYSSLINPLLAYGQDVSSSNQNAAAAQNIAGGNKTSGLIGGGISILGSVAAAY